MEITIIGAGPVGCYAGYLLATSGHNVSIYESKQQIGLPIQCTGILTFDFDQFNLDKGEFLVNTINRTEVCFPNGKKSTIKQLNYIVCRNKFDNSLAEKARKAGAKIYLNHTFLRKENKTLIIKDKKNKIEKKITPTIVIAADGPLSPTAKAYNFFHPRRQNYFGIQAVVKGNFDPDLVKTYFGSQVCSKSFLWLVPESETVARVGLATKENPKYYLDKFIKKHNFTILEKQAGLIPIYHPQQKLHKDNCYLLGDAASFVKATTFGGIVPGMKQAQMLVNHINCKNKNQSIKKLKSLNRCLKLHLMLRKVLNKFSDRDWNCLASYVAQEKIKKILGTYARDNPVPLLTKILIKEPRFFYFMKYLF